MQETHFLKNRKSLKNRQCFFMALGLFVVATSEKLLFMKVMLPVVDDKLSKNVVADGFHNIEYVCVFDSANQKCDWLGANKISETPGGLNSGLSEQGIFSIISLNISPMVLSMFNRNGIKVWKARGNDLDENLRLFQLSQLKVFTAEECRIAQACDSRSCSSCGSTCK